MIAMMENINESSRDFSVWIASNQASVPTQVEVSLRLPVLGNLEEAHVFVPGRGLRTHLLLETALTK